ncbi:MAG: type II toxin-antitoxin system Phd/YefM family antitoxin [Caldilineaceae bacterium]
MAIETVTSEYARLNMRDMLDAIIAGSAYIIERYREPTAVIISYTQWQKMQKRLRELELLMEAQQIEAKIENGEMGTIAHDDLKRLMLEKRAQGTLVHVGD